MEGGLVDVDDVLPRRGLPGNLGAEVKLLRSQPVRLRNLALVAVLRPLIADPVALVHSDQGVVAELSLNIELALDDLDPPQNAEMSHVQQCLPRGNPLLLLWCEHSKRARRRSNAFLDVYVAIADELAVEVELRWDLNAREGQYLSGRALYRV